jgi:hypothetical protein
MEQWVMVQGTLCYQRLGYQMMRCLGAKEGRKVWRALQQGKIVCQTGCATVVGVAVVGVAAAVVVADALRLALAGLSGLGQVVLHWLQQGWL